MKIWSNRNSKPESIEVGSLEGRFREGNGQVEKTILLENHLLVSGWILKKMAIEKVELLSNKDEGMGSPTMGYRTKKEGQQPGIDLEVFKESGFIYLFLLDFDIELVKWIKFTFDNGAIRVLPLAKISPINTSRKEFFEEVVTNSVPTIHTDKEDSCLLISCLASSVFNPGLMEGKSIGFGKSTLDPTGTLLIDQPASFDLLKHQMAELRRMNLSDEIEIIFSWQDPEIKEDQMKELDQLFFKFNTPFLISLPSEEVSRAGARNIAAGKSKSGKLIFLDSAHFPNETKWHIDLLNLLNDNSVGAVSVDIRFEDNTIAHNSYFENFKGKDILTERNIGLPVWARDTDSGLISTSCFAINKSVFQKLNGFDPIFLDNSFSDADICHKIKNLDLSIINSGIKTYNVGVRADYSEFTEALALGKEIYQNRYQTKD